MCIVSDGQCLMFRAVQRLSERVPQELLAAQLRIAVCAVRTSSAAQDARSGKPTRTSRLLASRGHDTSQGHDHVVRGGKPD